MHCSQAASSRSRLLVGGLTCPKKKSLEPALGHGAESWPAQLSGLLTNRELLATPLRAIWDSGENAGQQQRMLSHQEVPPEHKIRRPPETIISILSAMSPMCPSRAAPQPAGSPTHTPRCPGAPVGWPSLPHPDRSSLLRDMVSTAGFIPGPGSHLCVPTCLLRLFHCSPRSTRGKF